MVLFGTRKKPELRSVKRIAKLSLETASIIIQFLRYFDKFKKNNTFSTSSTRSWLHLKRKISRSETETERNRISSLCVVACVFLEFKIHKFKF